MTTPLVTTSTKLPPCCVRINPDNPRITFFGTYQLEKSSGLRHGSIDVYQDLNLTQSIATPSAVLDLKISPKDLSLLILAHSTGEIRIWKFSENLLSEITQIELTDPATLVTSVFFNPTAENQILATLTSGETVIHDLNAGKTEHLSESHTLECWTGAFGEIGPAHNTVFTGGDDARLIAHDLRTNDKIWSTGHRHHEAGVVSILCAGKDFLPAKSNEIWTGSYDDHLRIFDLRCLTSEDDNKPFLFPSLLPTQLHKRNLGGGVWRLIPRPQNDGKMPENTVLACCMYDGARIVLPDSGGAPVVQSYFKGNHESMCYGGDWSKDDEIVTCLFYDKVVHKWKPTLSRE